MQPWPYTVGESHWHWNLIIHITYKLDWIHEFQAIMFITRFIILVIESQEMNASSYYCFVSAKGLHAFYLQCCTQQR
jgi:hypothetical protein